MSVLTYVESNTESVSFKGMFNARGLQRPKNLVIPAKAGIQTKDVPHWIPACAGITVFRGLYSSTENKGFHVDKHQKQWKITTLSESGNTGVLQVFPRYY